MSQRTNNALSKYEKDWSIYWFETIDRLPEKSVFRSKFYDLSLNINITTDILLKYPEKPWDWSSISMNPNITFDFIFANLEKPWDWKELSKNTSIDFENVFTHPELPWCWYSLSSNLSITIEILSDNLEKPWEWTQLTGNNAFTKEDILAHPELPWDYDIFELLFGEPQEYEYTSNEPIRHGYYDEENSDDENEDDDDTPTERPENVESWNLLDWEEASLEKDISIEFVREHITGGWNWNALSYNKTLTFEFVLENIDKKWNWNALSYHKNITMENIQNYPQLPWSWQMVFTNPNLTLEVIEENIHQKYVKIPYDHPLLVSKAIFIREREREDNYRNLELIKKNNSSFPEEMFQLISEYI
jgi:hypothetical protein